MIYGQVILDFLFEVRGRNEVILFHPVNPVKGDLLKRVASFAYF